MEESTKKFLIVAIAVVAVLSIVACVACVVCGSTGDSSTPSTSTDGTTNPSYTTPSSSEPATYRVGEVITVNGFNPCQFSVQEVKRGSSAWATLQSANPFNYEPDVGYEYVLYKVWIKNTGSSKLSVASYDFPVYANGVEGEFAFAILPDNYHEFTMSSELLPGGETSGWIIKEIPANSNCKMAYETILGTVYAYVQF